MGYKKSVFIPVIILALMGLGFYGWLQLRTNNSESVPNANQIANLSVIEANNEGTVDAAGTINVYKYDGTTLLGKFLEADSGSIMYSTSTGIIFTAGPMDRGGFGYAVNLWNYSYYTSANCTTGGPYMVANYDNATGYPIGASSYAATDGKFYKYSTDNLAVSTTTYNSYWSGTGCVVASSTITIGGPQAIFGEKLCGAGDCKVKL